MAWPTACSRLLSFLGDHRDPLIVPVRTLRPPFTIMGDTARHIETPRGHIESPPGQIE